MPPMNVLDVFNQDAFGVVNLTEAINLLPYKPARIGGMGLFGREGITTTTVLIEESEGLLALLPTAPRGGPAAYGTGPKRTMRTLSVPHIPHDGAVLADDVQGVRAFGSGSQLQSVTTVVNNRLAQMRQNHEVTLEYHRLGAIQGVLLDADGTTTIYDLFTEFGVTQVTIDFALADAGTKVRLKCLEVSRAVEDALGAGTYDHIHAFCGATWFSDLIAHPDVEEAYSTYQEGKMLRNDPRSGFEFGGLIFEEYRGKLIPSEGSTPATALLDTDTARFFPVGMANLFKTYDAPADFIEAVNTPGRPVYAKQERMEYDRGIKLHTQSNPLNICHRPKVLVRGI